MARRMTAVLAADMVGYSRFGGGGHDLREVSRALGVRYVLEGSVRRDADSLRVTAQLIDGKTGSHL